MRFDHEIEVDVEADVTPAFKGNRDEPGRGEQVEITAVNLNGHDITHMLTAEQIEKLETAASEQAEDDRLAYADQEMDARDDR